MNLDIFDENYFRDLGWIVGNKIEGKEVQVREVFLVQEKLLKEEQFNLYGFFFPKVLFNFMTDGKLNSNI